MSCKRGTHDKAAITKEEKREGFLKVQRNRGFKPNVIERPIHTKVWRFTGCCKEFFFLVFNDLLSINALFSSVHHNFHALLKTMCNFPNSRRPFFFIIVWKKAFSMSIQYIYLFQLSACYNGKKESFLWKTKVFMILDESGPSS